MESFSAEEFDVIVVGGGPGGATASSLIAMQRNRVLLLERDHFPRHQIGESLLPATVHGICGLLGLADELAAAGFPKKRGGTFRWGKSPEPWTFKFAENSDARGGYAYQVERSKFDKMLLDNARRKGVDVREGCQVQEILFKDDRAVGVRFLDEHGSPRIAHARFIIDAGGNQSVQYNPYVGERVYSKFFQNMALYAYFENGARLPPPNQGNILCCAFKDGWFWYIPLSPSLTSVGAVASRESMKDLEDGHEATFNYFLEACPLIKTYLSGAKRVTEGQYGKFRIRKDYSYCNTKFWRPGLSLIGDAACFVDPVFSSGVHLATYSALLVARSINTCLRNPGEVEAPYFTEFENRYRREYGNFYQFCSAFYDMEQNTDSYFWAARKILKSGEEGNESFVRLIAGVSQDDPVFSSGDYFKARIGFGVWFQDMLSKSPLGEGVKAAGRTPEFDKSKFDPSQFMQGFTSEIVQMQLLALFKGTRPQDRPIFLDGLIPSRDGLYWARSD
jgi:halogenation protein CepH